MEHGQPKRLCNYPHFETNDPDEASKRIARQFSEHKVIDTASGYFRSMNTAQLELITVVESLVGGQDIRMVADDRFYLVALYRSGGTLYESQGHRLVVSTGSGVLMLPNAESYMRRTMASMTHVAISAPEFMVECDRLAGHHIDKPLQITGVIPKTSPVFRVVDHIIAELDSEDGLFALSPAAGLELQRALIASLVESTPNTYQPLVARPERTHKAPLWHKLHVRQAEQYMDDHLMGDISLGKLADAAGVSARALQDAFHSYRRESPLTVLRDKRLDRIHHELLHGSGDVRVKSIMYAFGFTNPGRFAALYARRHREKPNDTRRKNKNWRK